MGDPKKQRRKFESPRHPWRQDQIEAELKLIGEYGLRNKRELWRCHTILSRIRGIARSLLGKSGEEKVRLEKEFLQSLTRRGILPENATLDHVLDLSIKDILERRLQTLTYRKGLARTIHQARQLISHGHIKIGPNRVYSPSYLVPKAHEQHIRLDTRLEASAKKSE
ncbi:MAG: 30S ribosomal protein S4 [Candidatus Bathyarchaeia archaeon]